MVPNTFDWIEIRSSNIEQTAQFYTSLFGWHITDQLMVDGTDVWIFDTGSEPRLKNLRRGGIWVRPFPESTGFIVYVNVENIEATLKKVVELGGKVTSPGIDLGGGTAAFCTDPGGTSFGIYQDKPGS